MIWNEEMECMAREKRRNLQFQRLKETLNRVYERVPFYRQAFDERGIKPDDIKSLEDLPKLPFTTKADLRDHYPYGLFAVSRKDLVRIHASSGTTGKPTVVGYTKNDLETWAECVARLIVMSGGTAEDIAQVAFGYGLFTGAFGLHYGLEKIGATVVPASVGNTERQIMVMQDFETTILISTPSYALYMAEVAEQMGVDTAKLPLRLGLFGSEGWTEEMRKELEQRWHITATDNYGLSEVIGPGVSGECLFKNGMHINEDHFIVEIIDPETGEPLPEGKAGEVVITTITKEAFPLIRYRTKDISALSNERCVCGRTTARMTKIKGRTDDMLIIKGVNVFPSQIESVLIDIEGVAPQYQLVIRKKGYLDDLEVRVEFKEDWFTGRFSDLEALEERITRKLESVLSLSAKVKLVEPKSLTRFEGKAKRVIDLRNRN